MENEPSTTTTITDPLNDLGLTLLSADYRHIAITTLIIAVILAVTKFWRFKKLPSPIEGAAGILSILSIYSAIVVGSVFLLTKPPAIDRLEGIELAGIGLISFVIMLFLGIYQTYVSFWKK